MVQKQERCQGMKGWAEFYEDRNSVLNHLVRTIIPASEL